MSSRGVLQLSWIYSIQVSNSIILSFEIQNHDLWAISRAWAHNVIRLLPLPSSSQLYPVALAPLNGMQSPKAQLRPWIKFWMKRLNSCAENHHPTMHNSWCAQRDRIELSCPKSPLTDNSEFDRISWCYTCISPLCQNVLSACPLVAYDCSLSTKTLEIQAPWFIWEVHTFVCFASQSVADRPQTCLLLAKAVFPFSIHEAKNLSTTHKFQKISGETPTNTADVN